jgi:hypothetical protein
VAFQDRYLTGLTQDPLSAQSRAQHRNVLLVGAVSILVAQLNLVPTRISALGVNLQSDDRHAIRIALLIVVFYFTVSFLITASADILGWLVRYREGRDARSEAHLNLRRIDTEMAKLREQVADEPERRTLAQRRFDEAVVQTLDIHARLPLYQLLLPINLARAFIDFAVPIAVAITAIVVLALGL